MKEVELLVIGGGGGFLAETQELVLHPPNDASAANAEEPREGVDGNNLRTNVSIRVHDTTVEGDLH